MLKNEPQTVLLQLSHLRKYFRAVSGPPWKRDVRDVYAVDDVNLEVFRGETLGLVGESGCGKTTLARLILRLISVSDGSIAINGQEITQLKRHALKQVRRDMQLIFQDPFDSLNPRMKIGKILEEPLQLFGLGDAASRKARVLHLLETVGLDARFASELPSALSGGQRQRVGIARALALTPKLVICDEPVSALDVSVRAQIINLLEDLQEKFDLTYIFISHDLSLVEHISDRVAVMYLGRIVEIADNEAIFRRPHHPYTEALLSANPAADPLAEQHSQRIILQGDPPSPLQRPKGCRFHPRCPIAQAICTVEDPPLAEVEPGHLAACHFAKANPVLSRRAATTTTSAPTAQIAPDSHYEKG